jgi:hypothetical protein
MASAIPPTTSAAKAHRRRVWIARGVWGSILALLGWGAFILATGGREENESPEAEKPAADPQDPAAARDRQLARTILGQWHDTYMGTKRTITLDDDGRGEMIVEIVGSTTLRFEMVWSVADGTLRLRSLRGEPKFAAEMILRINGDRAEHRIIEAAPDRLLLVDRDGKTQLDWRRTP